MDGMVFFFEKSGIGRQHRNGVYTRNSRGQCGPVAVTRCGHAGTCAPASPALLAVAVAPLPAAAVGVELGLRRHPPLPAKSRSCVTSSSPTQNPRVRLSAASPDALSRPCRHPHRRDRLGSRICGYSGPSPPRKAAAAWVHDNVTC
ncbi:hypothetical protein ZWY2020_027834 [Hordeum vulgare]|nr:hypothetical protein ZWY2020_027834 [Hordeum vulgare]